MKIALVALGFSPVPPLLPRKQIKARGSASYVTSLLVLASRLSLVVTPLGLGLAGRLFVVPIDIASATILRILAIGILAPLAVGLLFGHLLGEHSYKAAAIIAKIANAMFMLCVLGLCIGVAPALWGLIGDGTIVALVATISAGLAAGFWLGGRERGIRASQLPLRPRTSPKQSSCRPQSSCLLYSMR